MLTNRQLSAQEALDWGIVNQLVEETELLEKARQTAQRIAKGPTQAFGNVRSLLMDSFDSTLDAQLEREAESILQAINSADGREGIKAFLEKRRPDFKGR
jgi:2-(1,2-epoxy-1,2-dihydrophenyl)acetyl-CoA isomerase